MDLMILLYQSLKDECSFGPFSACQYDAWETNGIF